MSAEDAYIESVNRRLHFIREFILDSIEDAVHEGMTEAIVYDMSEDAKNELISSGYRIEKNFDSDNGYKYRIFWNAPRGEESYIDLTTERGF
jgi:hypothetical protein